MVISISYSQELMFLRKEKIKYMLCTHTECQILQALHCPLQSFRHRANFKKGLISIIQIGKQGHIRLHKLARKWQSQHSNQGLAISKSYAFSCIMWPGGCLCSFRLLAEILKLDLKHVNSVTNCKKYFHYLVDVIEKPVLQLR